MVFSCYVYLLYLVLANEDVNNDVIDDNVT